MFRPLAAALALLVASPAARAATVAWSVKPGEALAPRQERAVRVAPGEKGSGADEMELVLSLDGGRTFPLRVSREVPRGETVLVFRVPNLPAAAARLALRAGTEGEGETTLAVSEPFAITPAPGAPLEELASVRGEAALRDAAAREPGSRFPAPGLTGVPESLSELALDTDADQGPSGTLDLAPGQLPALLLPGLALEGGGSPAPATPRLPLFRPKRE